MTPRGAGGIAAIRLTGASSTLILRGIFAGRGMRPGRAVEAGGIAYGFIRDPENGLPVDEVLVARLAEDDYEINCHGGHAAVREVMRVLRRSGAREVPAEESLERSGWLRGRDAIQREAHRLLLSARSERAARHLLAQFEGALSKEVTRLIACVEKGEREEALEITDGLLRHAAFGAALTEPVRVVMAGLPNSGKSSLLNALTGRERVIVAEEAGTTRDVVDAETLIEGVPFHLHDTAGLRDAPEEAEAEGVARARAAAAGADCLVVVLDLSRAVAPAEAEFLFRAAKEKRAVIACLNKCDLADEDFRLAVRAPGERRVPRGAETFIDLARRCVGENAPVCLVSCRTGEGVDNLRGIIFAACIPAEPDREDAPLIFSRRQAEIIKALRSSLAGDAPGAAETLSLLIQG